MDTRYHQFTNREMDALVHACIDRGRDAWERSEFNGSIKPFTYEYGDMLICQRYPSGLYVMLCNKTENPDGPDGYWPLYPQYVAIEPLTPMEKGQPNPSWTRVEYYGSAPPPVHASVLDAIASCCDDLLDEGYMESSFTALEEASAKAFDEFPNKLVAFEDHMVLDENLSFRLPG